MLVKTYLLLAAGLVAVVVATYPTPCCINSKFTTWAMQSLVNGTTLKFRNNAFVLDYDYDEQKIRSVGEFTAADGTQTDMTVIRSLHIAIKAAMDCRVERQLKPCDVEYGTTMNSLYEGLLSTTCETE